jgi:hypothetical protein
MNATSFTALGVAVAALITAISSIIIFLIGQRRSLQNDHLQRAFEKHLDRYERIFVSARTAQDSLRNFRTISGKVDDRSDPFLFQLLAIAENACHDYCVAVTWSHNPGMLYLSKRLEETCLQARDLLLKWLAVRRLHLGEVAFVRKGDDLEAIPVDSVLALVLGDYRELRIETRRLVFKEDGEASRLANIDQSLSRVIDDLKKVMAY